MQLIDLKYYLDIVHRRIYWIIIPFLVTVLVALAYGLATPRLYKGETLILIVPQKVPESYVQSLVSLNMEERLRTIKQQVTSRTNMEVVLKQYNLFTEPRHEGLYLEQKVQLLRKRIGIQVSRGTAFTITFLYEDPQKAKDVADALASNFISQNLRIRESQALGTSQFLIDELDVVRRKLEEKEEELKTYRQKHMGGMPEDLNTNMAMIAKLQTQLDQLNGNLRSAQERKLIIQEQIANAQMMEKQSQTALLGSEGTTAGSETTAANEDSPNLASLKNRLSILELTYTENHPDIRKLKALISKLESSREATPNEASSSPIEPMPVFSMAEMLKPQIEQINLEISSIRSDIRSAMSEVDVYNRRIEETPKRQQELISQMRDYDNLKGLYKSLLDRKLEADLAVNMEKKQKGEQFQVIDPAKLPEVAVHPNLLKIFGLAFVLGLCLGGGFGYLREILDTSFRSPEEAAKELNVPVLMTIPTQHTADSLRVQKRRSVLAAASVVTAFVLSAAGIVLFTKGVEATENFVKSVLGMS
ncbi:MAG: hypothetical protein JW836_16540 [Deltaproteobacteria bacterium]|nr:hypothetical protein [Deltaproteobacteria bacterium]